VSPSSKRNQLRIIGGRWRGRKLTFPDTADLRPTPDRVRETLFNWLQPVIVGARCLDLFSGSGALGFEAASRGAADVIMVDQDRTVTNSLTQHVTTLQATEVHIACSNGIDYLNGTPSPFDIVFLDPPYQQDSLESCCHLLEDKGWLSAKAHVYIEHSSSTLLPGLPANWQVKRSKKAGNVSYHLVFRG